jgi:hypothetical protein
LLDLVVIRVRLRRVVDLLLMGRLERSGGGGRLLSVPFHFDQILEELGNGAAALHGNLTCPLTKVRVNGEVDLNPALLDRLFLSGHSIWRVERCAPGRAPS